MQKTKLKINTEAITEAGFETGTSSKPLSLMLIGGILIALLSIVGCSETSYTGSMLTVPDVDRYITIGEDSVCLLVGDESTCLTFVPETDDESRPIIHVQPEKIIYVFYREGVPIIQAEIVTDTTEIMEQVMAPIEDNQPVQDTVETSVDDSTQQPDDETQQSNDDDTQPHDGNGNVNGKGNGN